MTRAAKGTVSIESVKGRLRLCWRYQGQRFYLTLGYPDTAKHHAIARLKANQIQSDLLYERFDPSLAKYKPNATAPKSLTLLEIYDRFIEYKRPQCSPSTMRSQYRPWRKRVTELPTDDPHEAGTIRDWVLSHMALDSGKRFLGSLSECCNWAIESGLLDKNNFSGMASKICLPKKSKEDEDICPFNKREIDLLIDLFKTNKYYKHYYPFIYFCFLTGCRPSEALALQWKHIDKRFERITFEQALVMAEDGLKVKGGLKTQDRKEFRCNSALTGLLKATHQAIQKPTREGLVFPSPRGKHIDFHNFANRAWKTILSEAGIPYRKPYQTRHTFITLALEKLSVQDVAALVGNSPEIIYRHYAGVSRDLELPLVL
ncbi:MAG: site-specific integrase [Leptolyngbya sp. ERB_1_1]